MSAYINSEPHIKIIPPNPLTHSILIAYCYANNKTIQCQAKWTRFNPSFYQNLQSKNGKSHVNLQTGNTYKCSPLDFNQIIQVEATFQYMNKVLKLTAQTECVKLSSELFQRKNQQKWVICKITNSNQQIQCKMGLQSSRILQLTYGARQFNMQISSLNVMSLANNAFKAAVHTLRYEFLTFFNDCTLNKQRRDNEISLAYTFQFIFHSQSDRDLTLLKIVQNSFPYKDETQHKQTSECLNIFDDEEVSSELGIIMQNSLPEFFSDVPQKQRPATNYVQNSNKNAGFEDLPSINLRGSFQELQKYAVPQVNSNKKGKSKLKTQTNRQFNYQYPKSRQKTQIPRSPLKKPILNQETLRQQISELKQENSQMRKQMQNMHTIMKQNNSLKKKYYQLSEEVSRLQLQRKQILADKLKWKSSYHKEQKQKEKLKNQLEEMIKLLQKSNFAQSNQLSNHFDAPKNINAHSFLPNDASNHLSQASHGQNYLSKAYHGQGYLCKAPGSQGYLPKAPRGQGHLTNQIYEQNRKKIQTQLINPLNGKKNFLQNYQQRTMASHKLISNNQSGIQNDKSYDSNNHSRKQLRFPTYSYKYYSNNNIQ